MPTVVLVNAGSARPPRLQRWPCTIAKLQPIIGEKSYGKGVVQQVIPFWRRQRAEGYYCQVVRSRRTSINHKGITPDQTAALSDDDAKAGNDTQLQAAEAYLQAH